MSHTHFCHISKINSDKKKKTPPFLSPSPPLSDGTPPPLRVRAGDAHARQRPARGVLFFLIFSLRQPISPICRTPLFHISRNLTRHLFLSLSNPISPICRTHLSPVSQNLIRHLFFSLQPHISHMSHTPFPHISEFNSTSFFSLSNPISPICRTPLFPISQNLSRFFFLSNALSPICRTPFFPISQKNQFRFFPSPPRPFASTASTASATFEVSLFF